MLVEVADLVRVLSRVSCGHVHGMGHRYYHGAEDALSDEDPADVLASRLFARGGIDYLHVHGNVATVDLSKGYTSEGIVDIIAGLFAHYEI